MKFAQLKSVLGNKCPKCLQGNFYKSSNPFKVFFDKNAMNKSCSHCGQSFEPETGYYYGAMYVSYGIGVSTFSLLWLLQSIFFPQLSNLAIIGILAFVLLLISPLNLYLSRLIWINLFVQKDS